MDQEVLHYLVLLSLQESLGVLSNQDYQRVLEVLGNLVCPERY
jgi:hypothetical protein